MVQGQEVQEAQGVEVEMEVPVAFQEEAVSDALLHPDILRFASPYKDPRHPFYREHPDRLCLLLVDDTTSKMHQGVHIFDPQGLIHVDRSNSPGYWRRSGTS